MTSASARTAGVIVALYFAYEFVAGVARQLTQISVLLAQHTDMAMVVLTWVGVFVAPLPYVVAGFALFWLWPVKNARNMVVAVIVRAAVASAAGAVLSWIIGAISATTVSGGWFTSMPREYSFPEWFFGQAPSMLVGSIFQNFPVLALVALVAATLLFRRVLPNGHSETLKATTGE